MTCACGREAECDTAERDGGENGPQFYTIVANGFVCECAAFVCHACGDRLWYSDLCASCNTREQLLERAS